SALRMLKPTVNNKGDWEEFDKPATALLLLRGFMVGTITGLLGIGGGFLIVPALYFLAKLPVKTAVGTALVIIMINSLF
ncbi:MAG: sulfite exporter TauE/SafE family protein, partial [Bacteroidetes bacterium]